MFSTLVLFLQLTPLQTVISNAADKRIMVLDDFATSKDAALNDSHRSFLKSSVDKRHHPVQVISKKHKKEIVNKIIICRESAKEIVIDHFKQNKWFLDVNLDIVTLEG